MTRKGKVVLGVVIVAGVGMGWRFFRPHFDTAPIAELEKLIDPRLLEGNKPDPMGEGRWKRYVEALKKIDRGPGSGGKTLLGEQFLVSNRKAIANVQAILDEGPLYHPLSMLSGGDGFPMQAELKNIAKSSSFAAKEQVARGDYKGAVDSLETSFRLLKGVRANETSIIDDLVNIAIEAILYVSVANLVRRPGLPEEQAMRLLALIPPAPKQDADLARAIRGEFRSGVLSWIDDPATRFKQVAEEFRGVMPDEKPKDDGLYGNYDPYATAKAASAIYMPMLLSTGATISTVDLSGDKLKAEFEKELPAEPDQSKEGWRADVEMRWYKLRMNGIGNSFGKMMLQYSLKPTDLMKGSFKIRTGRELVRALIASTIYRKRHGALPPSLSALVSEGLIKTEPHDFLADAPLRYDPSKRVLYSVGADRKDDGGAFTIDMSSKEPDFGYRIPATRRP